MTRLNAPRNPKKSGNGTADSSGIRFLIFTVYIPYMKAEKVQTKSPNVVCPAPSSCFESPKVTHTFPAMQQATPKNFNNLNLSPKMNSERMKVHKVEVLEITVEEVTEVIARERLYVQFAKNHIGQIIRLMMAISAFVLAAADPRPPSLSSRQSLFPGLLL
mmetsp:Transcript_29774/g.47589  ORF Transcript_29774/g.47589 Transcript_29774/m.47589 type:complete len:161 (+) Transcript_29774:500-982(+)